MSHGSPTSILLNIGHAMDHWILVVFAYSWGVIAGVWGVEWTELTPFNYGALFMFGAGSIVSGRLGDHWGRWIMMVIFFVGMGVSALIIALCTNKWQIGAALTLILVHQFFPGGIGGASKLISFSLGIALVLTACALIFRKRLQAFAQSHAPTVPNPRRTFWLTVLTGAILGILVSISSVGAGALGVTALFFLYPQLPAHRIVGSDIAHAVPLTLVAGVGHWILSSVDWFLLGSLLVGSLPGIWVGSHISAKVPEKILRPILAGMLVLIGGKLIATY